MSVPASFRMGPGTTNSLASKRYILVHILIIYLSLLLPLWLVVIHFEVYDPTWTDARKLRFYFQLPLFLFEWYIVWVAMAIVIAAVFLQSVKWIHPPKEGYFRRDPKDKDYRYWTLRATIKKFAVWLSHNFWFPTTIMALVSS